MKEQCIRCFGTDGRFVVPPNHSWHLLHKDSNECIASLAIRLESALITVETLTKFIKARVP